MRTSFKILCERASSSIQTYLALLEEADIDDTEVEDALAVVEALEAARRALLLGTKFSTKQMFMLAAIARGGILEEHRPVKVKQVVPQVLPPKQREPRLQVPKPLQKPPRKNPQDDSPMGTYGCWDYANKEWEVLPTLEDIPEIMRQKQQRYPGVELWASHEKMVAWFITKGWIAE